MMESRYTVHRSRALQAHKGRMRLAIAIIDSGNVTQLDEAIAWYRSNLNQSLFVVTEGEVDGRFEGYGDISVISFKSWATAGERINAVANECGANYFLITRSDLYLARFDGPRLFSKGTSRIAWASVIANCHKEVVPSVRIPRLDGRYVEVDSTFPAMEAEESVRTLYPVMGLGLYDRAAFQRLRGFDEAIESDYYQLLDWGLRAGFMGHRVLATSALLMQFIERESVIEDRTERAGVARFHTKALSLKKRKNGEMALSRPPRSGFDRQVWKDEVKRRLRWQAKEDLHSLVTGWEQGGGV